MKKERAILVVIALICSVSATAHGVTIDKPYNFGSGDYAIADQVNADFDVLYEQINLIRSIVDIDQGLQKMIVNGTIETTSGGVTFPDRTTQATAFTGDADTLDGMDSSAFLTSSHTQDFSTITGTATDAQIPDTITIDYAASAGAAGDANTLDGIDSTGFSSSSHAHSFSTVTGTATDAQIPNTITIDYAASAGSAANAGTLDGLDSTAFATSSHGHDSLDASDGSPTDALIVDGDGQVGVGVATPNARLHIAHQNWNLTTTEGDFKIGNDTYRLKMSASTGGAGAGVARIRSHGGLNTLHLGAGTNDVLTILETGVGINQTSPSENLVVGTDLGSFSGNRIAVGGTTDYPAVMIGENSTERGWMLWSTTNDLMALGTETAAFKGDAIYLKDGNVGIGNGSPTGKLDITGGEVRVWDGSAIVNLATGQGDLYVEDDLEVDGTVAVGTSIGLGTTSPIGKLDVRGNEVRIWDGSASVNQATGVGELYVENDLEVDGDGFFEGNVNIAGVMSAGVCNCPSDKRWKKEIMPLEDALNKALSLEGVSYKWKTDEYPERHFSEDPQVGFIAQDVEKVLPEAVHTDEEGYKYLAYDKITVVLVEAIKELKAENEALKDEIRRIKEAMDI